jgi:hypothetical protein
MDRRCGLCLFWEHESDDVYSNGQESEYGGCNAPIPTAVFRPVIKARMNRWGGEGCAAFIPPVRCLEPIVYTAETCPGRPCSTECDHVST